MAGGEFSGRGVIVGGNGVNVKVGTGELVKVGVGEKIGLLVWDFLYNQRTSPTITRAALSQSVNTIPAVFLRVDIK
jgi:hypothetical protein